MADDPKALGRKIAFYRNRIGLSQPQLGKLIDRSVAWVSQVERGARKIDRMSVLEALAEALSVPVTELSGDTEPQSPRPQAATTLSLALCSADALQAVLADVAPIDVERLRRGADAAWKLAHAAKYDELGDLLGVLIPELEFAARKTTGVDRLRVLTAKGRVYHAAAGALSKLGETAAAWVAVDRATAAAEEADEPLLMAEGAFRLAIVFQSAKRFDLARQTALTAARALDQLVDAAEPEAIAVRGALHLQLAVAAARLGEGEEAYRWLARAREAADQLGVDRNDYNTEFGPTNVLLHEVNIAVELGDAGRALRIAADTDAQRLSPERQARLLIDQSRAHAQRGHVDMMVDTVRRADDIAAQQVRGHPLVADMIRDALARHPRDVGIRELAKDFDLISRVN